jgi:hypothetical protein
MLDTEGDLFSRGAVSVFAISFVHEIAARQQKVPNRNVLVLINNLK